MKFSCIILSLLFILPVKLPAQQQFVLQDGEILQYKVKWAFFRLGTITVRTNYIQTDSANGAFKISMKIVSNPHLPFISIDEINESLINISDGMSKSFYGRYIGGSGDYEIECNYRRDKRESVYIERNCLTNAYSRIEIIRDIDPYLDGPTLFLFTRSHIHTNRTFRMPTMIEVSVQR